MDKMVMPKIHAMLRPGFARINKLNAGQNAWRYHGTAGQAADSCQTSAYKTSNEGCQKRAF